ncbi:metalloendopeptidase [Stygiomarasmius scandens]|uniref:Metalloendopeptidase n=1 Tax=Marasmiellus scandens TaxID=2682957 RepID=A0ABR1K3R3_9AGAR
MANLVPPQAAPKWNHTPSQIKQIIEQIIAKTRQVQNSVAALPESECKFRSVFLALADARTQLEDVSELLAFYKSVSPDKELRDASNDSETLKQEFDVESSMRLDVFAAKLAAERNIRASGEWDELNAEERRLVDKMILDGKRAGLALGDEKRQQLAVLKTELSKLCLECRKNANEENGKVTFTLEELDGIPADILNEYTKRVDDSGKEVYEVAFRAPDFQPLQKYIKKAETRQRSYEAYESRLEVNASLLDRVFQLRQEIASILGYRSWADYVTEERMVGSGQGIIDFLDDLHRKFLPIGEKDRSNLMALKEAEYKALGLPFDGKFNNWDRPYYETKFTEKTLDLDSSAVKDHFPVEHVVPTMLDIYQNLLSVKFVEMKDEEGATWHPDVQRFSVWEKDAKDENGFIGYCYLDIYSRPNKYSNPSVWPLLPGYATTTSSPLGPGKRMYPVAAMVAGFTKSSVPSSDPEVKSKPALMRHFDVVQLFHELGHIFHHLLSHTQFARFHGTTGSLDFVEAPSQMLENWCWEKSILKVLSKHWKTGESMSEEMIDKLLKSRWSTVGMFYLYQLFLAKFDIEVHTDPEPVDYTRLRNDLREEVVLVKYDKPCPAQAAFGHLFGGYDVGYYGYTYSLVFASDMYATVFKADPLDPACGRKYREQILRPGSSRDDLDILKDFLGREPDSNAFIKQLLAQSPLARQ